MSHRELQAALVLAEFDDEFAARLRADPDGVLAPLGLAPHERAQLAAVDPRALRTDPLRRRRTLRVLAEEYKAATTLALAETRALAFAEGFFRSPYFAAAVRAPDRPMAIEFGRFLAEAAAAGRLRTPLIAEVIRLELTMARCRRTRELPPHPGLALNPGVAVGQFDGAVLDAIQRIEHYLFEVGLMPQIALCDDAPRLPTMPAPQPDAPLYLLFTPSTTGVSLAGIDADLYVVLHVFAEPVPRVEAGRALAAAGITRGTDELVSSLLEEGLLAEGPAAGALLLA